MCLLREIVTEKAHAESACENIAINENNRPVNSVSRLMKLNQLLLSGYFLIIVEAGVT